MFGSVDCNEEIICLSFYSRSHAYGSGPMQVILLDEFGRKISRKKVQNLKYSIQIEVVNYFFLPGGELNKTSGQNHFVRSIFTVIFV